MSDFKKQLYDDWEFLLVAITTALTGIIFLMSPGILEDRSAYAFIVNVLDDDIFSIPTTTIGIVGIVLFIRRLKKYRSVLLTIYQFIWVILLLAYAWRAVAGYPNSSWVMAGAINIMIFLVALWGDSDASK